MGKAVEAVKCNGKNMDFEVRGGSFDSYYLIWPHVTSLGLNDLSWKMR